MRKEYFQGEGGGRCRGTTLTKLSYRTQQNAQFLLNIQFCLLPEILKVRKFLHRIALEWQFFHRQGLICNYVHMGSFDSCDQKFQAY